MPANVLRRLVLQLKPPFLVQHHQADAGDRFGHRVKAENSVRAHRLLPLIIHVAVGLEVDDLAAACDEADCARQLSLVDVSLYKT